MRKSLSKSLTFLVAAIIVAQLNFIVLAEELSTPPIQNNIIITNNLGIADTIKVTNLKSGDVVNVYADDTITTIIGTSTVSTKSTEAIVSIPQLGTSSGSIFVTVTSAPLIESPRIVKSYPAEPVSPRVENIAITNNVLIKDTVTVTGLTEGDIIKVYDLESAGKVLGTAVVAKSKSDVTISIANLPNISIDKIKGAIYISATNSAKLESARVKVEYDPEPVSLPLNFVITEEIPAKNTITIENNGLIADIINVTGLTVDDIIKVYDLESAGKVLGTATVAKGKTDVTISISKLPNIPIDKVKGNLYISITNKAKLESVRVKVEYNPEQVSEALNLLDTVEVPAKNTIFIANNVSIADIVKVTGLLAGDIIKVYDSENLGKVLGTATVAAGKNELIVNIPKLSNVPSAEGKYNLYVSVTNKTKLESVRVKVEYNPEQVSEALNLLDTVEVPAKNTIFIANNVSIADTVTVTGLTVGDIIKVYDLESAGKVLGTATVATGKTDVTINISKLPNIPIDKVKGNLYISVTNKAKLESARVMVDYDPEQASLPLNFVIIDEIPARNTINIENNVSIADTIKVTGLLVGDIIKLYDSENLGKVLGTATVEAGKNEVTVSISKLPNIPSEEGKCNLYVSVTNKTKLESVRAKVEYELESVSLPLNFVKTDEIPAKNTLTIENNGLMADTISVTGLTVGDIIKVYDLESAGKVLGTATVATGKTDVTISISKLPNIPIDKVKGNLYISVTNKAKLESARVMVDYDPEQASLPLNFVIIDEIPARNTINIENNVSIADTIKVTGLLVGDIIKVYDSETLGKVLGTATVVAGKNELIVNIPKLPNVPSAEGKYNLYVSVTNKTKLESVRVKVEYEQEPVSEPLDPTFTETIPAKNTITIANKASMPDTVTLTGLKAGDIVRVYDSETLGKVLGTATVATGKNEVTVSIANLPNIPLGEDNGTVYISLTNKAKLESVRVKGKYVEEAITSNPAENKIVVINNVGKDLVLVYGLKAGDVVKVYKSGSETDKTVLGTTKVAVKQTYATLSITQLGASGGDIYMSVTSLGLKESERVKKSVDAE